MAERFYAPEWFRFTDSERALLEELLDERIMSMREKTGDKFREVISLRNTLSRYGDPD